jgi:uncharacterized membrane protein
MKRVPGSQFRLPIVVRLLLAYARPMRLRALAAGALVYAMACSPESTGTPPAPPVVPPSSTPIDPWQRAQARGVDFRAVGQEPGWSLEVDYQGSMTLLYDYGERELTAASPALTHVSGRSTLELSTESGPVQVTIEDRPCSDAMSGQRFPSTVIVDIGDRRLEGCGRALD